MGASFLERRGGLLGAFAIWPGWIVGPLGTWRAAEAAAGRPPGLVGGRDRAEVVVGQWNRMITGLVRRLGPTGGWAGRVVMGGPRRLLAGARGAFKGGQGGTVVGMVDVGQARGGWAALDGDGRRG